MKQDFSNNFEKTKNVIYLFCFKNKMKDFTDYKVFYYESLISENWLGPDLTSLHIRFLMPV